MRNTLITLGVVNFLGIVFTFLVPESKGRSLEEMSGEAEEEHVVEKEHEATPEVKAAS